MEVVIYTIYDKNNNCSIVIKDMYFVSKSGQRIKFSSQILGSHPAIPGAESTLTIKQF